MHADSSEIAATRVMPWLAGYTTPREGCHVWGDPIETGRVDERALDEISDFVPSRVSPGVFWALEDSGADAILWALDETGATLGTLTLDGVDNTDWEDLAVAACPDDARADCLWVGDVGDNALARDEGRVHVIAEPEPAMGDHASPVTYRFRYPDGAANVEGLAVGPDLLPLLVTKRVDATAELWKFPALDEGAVVTVEYAGRVGTGDASDEHAAEATSAELTADGKRLLVRTYGKVWQYSTTRGLPGVATALPAPDESQGEAAAWDVGSDGYWLTSEGPNQPIWFVPCER